MAESADLPGTGVVAASREQLELEPDANSDAAPEEESNVGDNYPRVGGRGKGGLDRGRSRNGIY